MAGAEIVLEEEKVVDVVDGSTFPAAISYTCRQFFSKHDM